MAGPSTEIPRTLLVGIDGASHRVLEPLFESGAIPHLESLFEDGASGALTSQIPPWTASAWPSLYTGTNPGKHGVFGFLAFEGYDWDVVNATHVTERPLWQYVAGHDGRSVVVNVPVTHPPRAFDGALVPGYAAPEEPRCHPAGLLADLEDAIGEYRIYGEHEGSSTADRETLLAEYRELIEMRGRAYRYLHDRFDPAFGFVQFQATDTVCHDLPGDREAYRQVYGAVDDQLGDILAAVEPSIVAVVSDHGLGPYNRRVSVNEFLRDHGYVETTASGSGMPTWAAIRDGRLRPETRRIRDRAFAALTARLAASGLTAQRIGRVLDRLGLTDLVLEYVPSDALRNASERVDFRTSRAYARSRVECGVRINLAGREPDGVVPEREYESTRDDLVDLLASFRTPDGEPVFEDVARREAYFEGEHAADAVDVVAVPGGFDSYVTTWLTGEVFEPVSGPAWDHKRDGVIALAGDGVDEAASLDGAHLFDVAPTLLAAMGLPASERMDGSVLPPVEPVGERSYPPFEARELTATDEAAVEARLADLGYLE